jgi:opacity protein-like surface antigen
LQAEKNNGVIGRGFIGYDINRYFALESGFSYFINKPYFDSKQGRCSDNISTTAVDIEGKGKLPIVRYFDLYAKLGANYLMSRSSIRNNVGNFKVAFGVGADYRITANIIANIEWLRFTGNLAEEDVDYQPNTDAFLLGLRYNFNAFDENLVAPITNTLTDTGIYLGLEGGLGMTNWYRYNNFTLYRADGAIYSNVHAKQGNGAISRVFVGYDINRYFAFESGFIYFFNQAYFTSSNLGDTDNIKTIVFDLYGKGKLPIIQNLDLYAKLGANCLMRHTAIHSSARRFGDNDNIFRVAYGAGVDYYITSNVVANIEWVCLNGSSKFISKNYQPNTDVFMVGLRYRFDL